MNIWLSVNRHRGKWLNFPISSQELHGPDLIQAAEWVWRWFSLNTRERSFGDRVYIWELWGRDLEEAHSLLRYEPFYLGILIFPSGGSNRRAPGGPHLLLSAAVFCHSQLWLSAWKGPGRTSFLTSSRCPSSAWRPWQVDICFCHQ